MDDPAVFSAMLDPGRQLRPYQVGPARAIAESMLHGLGRQFAVVFSRQAGKDELLAQLVAWALAREARRGGQVVLAAPSFRPQGALMRDRLLARLDSPVVRAAGAVRVTDGYAVRVGRASARFLSAAPGSHARGQTADLLLVANEAQDIQPEVWDAVFDPMAASTNATTCFFGTVWDGNGLPSRQIRVLEQEQRRDGVQRVWRVTWDEVARTLPAYVERVRQRMAQLGPNHPFIRTAYCLEELHGESGLFPPHRMAMLQGTHARRHRPEPGKRYALLVDVAGEEEAGGNAADILGTARRDSTALSVVEIGGEERRPHFRVIDRRIWTGTKQTRLHDEIVALACDVWRARAVVIDATGVGAGLASFLAASLGKGGCAVVPFTFTAASKSALGWDLLALVDTGRLKEYARDSDPLTALFWEQLERTTFATEAGPGKRLRWSVPAGRGHDDLVMSLALVAALDGLDLRERTARGR